MLPVDDYLYSAAESRAIDADAMAQLQVPGYVLMQRAADAALAVLLDRFPGERSISVVCGKGNNAGDAYLLAVGARRLGLAVQLLTAAPPSSLQGDAATAFTAAQQSGLQADENFLEFTGGVIVDGLLGTGLQGPPRSEYAWWIEQINCSGLPVFSLDVPSGVETDSGATPGAAIQATCTLSFITRKIGLYTGAGLAAAGQLLFDDLGVPQSCFPASPVTRLFWRADTLPSMEVNTYKHRQGHVVIAGGDESMPGAVIMAAEAALRVGAGMVTVLTRAQHTTALVSRTPEVMVLGFSPTDDDVRVTELLSKAGCVVLGPGLGRGKWSEALYHRVEASGRPTVVDADGLSLLAAAGGWHGGPLTISPHVAEAARLLGCEVAEVQASRLMAAQQLAHQYGCQGVVKGAGSIIFSQHSAELAICAHGNPGMATAGMGDVLSGMLGGLLGHGSDQLSPHQALRAGVALHSAAADHAALELGQRSLQATDVITALPHLL